MSWPHVFCLKVAESLVLGVFRAGACGALAQGMVTGCVGQRPWASLAPMEGGQGVSRPWALAPDAGTLRVL